jgi:hypothetical protein
MMPLWLNLPASRRPGEPSPSLAAMSSATPMGAAAVLERLRGPIRWISDTRTVKLDDQLREALKGGWVMTEQREPWCEQHDRHVMDWVTYWMAKVKDQKAHPRQPPYELIAEVIALWRSRSPRRRRGSQREIDP